MLDFQFLSSEILNGFSSGKIILECHRGTQLASKREARSEQVLEYSERKRSLKKTQVEANFYYRSQKIGPSVAVQT